MPTDLRAIAGFVSRVDSDRYKTGGLIAWFPTRSDPSRI